MEKSIGSKVRQIRELKGFSQDYIANELGISQRAYSKIERDEVKMDWEKITEISKIFEVDPLDIVQFDDNLVFHNCSNSGKINNQHNHFLPEKVIEQYEARIKQLEDEVSFLKNLIDKKIN